MTEIDRQIIELFRLLTSEQKEAFIDLAKVLSFGVITDSAQTDSSTKNC